MGWLFGKKNKGIPDENFAKEVSEALVKNTEKALKGKDLENKREVDKAQTEASTTALEAITGIIFRMIGLGKGPKDVKATVGKGAADAAKKVQEKTKNHKVLYPHSGVDQEIRKHQGTHERIKSGKPNSGRSK